jgi:hypothetical protein
MMLVTKYLGRTDRGKTVYPPPPSGSGVGERGYTPKEKKKIIIIL